MVGFDFANTQTVFFDQGAPVTELFKSWKNAIMSTVEDDDLDLADGSIPEGDSGAGEEFHEIANSATDVGGGAEDFGNATFDNLDSWNFFDAVQDIECVRFPGDVLKCCS